jgi:hypothetical protein
MGIWKAALLLAPLLFPLTGNTQEARDGGVTLAIDDDLFSTPGRDRDYTGGIALTISGEPALRLRLSTDPVLARLDRALLRTRQDSAELQHAFAAGVMAFTPGDVAAQEPLLDDRPYASLVYLGSSRRYVSRERGPVYNSQLVIGVMGLDAVGAGHRAIHKLVSSDPLRGYDHQISAGGEPTVRYSLARQAPVGNPSVYSDYKWTLAGSIGTVTEGSIAFNARWGRIRSPWWSFAPEQNMYTQDAQPMLTAPAAETFFAAGARLRVRAYNAFLQGQFRHSTVRHSVSDLNPVLTEVWAGMVMRRSSGFEIRYLARWGSPELREGPGARDMLWGSVEFVRPFAAF